MRFVETPIFTREVTQVLSDEEYRAVQLALQFRPEQGPVIPRSGGVRLVYYWDKPTETIYMLFAYRKSEQEDLTGACAT